MARIFISYARQDGAEIANELANRLRAAEHEVFLDVESIRAGTRWKTELERRIKWSDLIVVLVTPGSNESDFVFEEIEQGETHQKHIVPVQIGETPLPVHLRGTWQAITLRDDDLDRVLLEIEQTVGQVSRRGYHRSILVAVIALVGVIALVAIIGVVGFLASRSRNPQIDAQATENALLTRFAPTADAEGVAVMPTNTPTVTLTRTPRPTSTPRPPTATPTLTPPPTDIPLSAILYQDDFEDERAEGWDFVVGAWNTVAEDNGNAVLRGRSRTRECASAHIGSSSWQNYAVDLRFKLVTNAHLEVTVRTMDFDNFYAFVADTTDFHYGLHRKRRQQWTALSSQPMVTSSTDWNALHIEIEDDRLRASLNGIDLSDAYDDVFSSGFFGLVICTPSRSLESIILFDDILIWALDE